MEQGNSSKSELKYETIKKNILSLISSQLLKPNDKIPGENEIARRFGVSVITARKALSDLVNEGFIYRIKGKGSFVSLPNSPVQEKRLRMIVFLLPASEAVDSSFMKMIRHAERTVYPERRSSDAAGRLPQPVQDIRLPAARVRGAVRAGRRSVIPEGRHHAGAAANDRAAALGVKGEIFFLLFTLNLVLTHELLPGIARFVAALAVAGTEGLTRQHSKHSHRIGLSGSGICRLPQHRSIGLKRLFLLYHTTPHRAPPSQFCKIFLK